VPRRLISHTVRWVWVAPTNHGGGCW
jgi:hypothetical protein